VVGLDRLFNAPAIQVLDVTLTLFECIDFCVIDVKAENVEAVFGKSERQWETDVTHADNADEGVMVLDLLMERCGGVVHEDLQGRILNFEFSILNSRSSYRPTKGEDRPVVNRRFLQWFLRSL
jgi:hypothetical protein